MSFRAFLVAVGLSMDAFAVSICMGLSAVEVSFKQMLIAGAYFGGFQALMPLIGYWARQQLRIPDQQHRPLDRLRTACGNWYQYGRRSPKGLLQRGHLVFREDHAAVAVATSASTRGVGISLAFQGRDRSCCQHDRHRHLRAIRRRRQNRQRLRGSRSAAQITGGISPDIDRHEDSPRASRIL